MARGCGTSLNTESVLYQELFLKSRRHVLMLMFALPAIQHMAPYNFGRRCSAAVIGLQMASAYIGSTFMPMVFGHLQQVVGIGIMPMYLMVFAILNIGLLEMAYRKCDAFRKEA